MVRWGGVGAAAPSRRSGDPEIRRPAAEKKNLSTGGVEPAERGKVPPTGVEPATYGTGNRRSIH